MLEKEFFKKEIDDITYAMLIEKLIVYLKVKYDPTDDMFLFYETIQQNSNNNNNTSFCNLITEVHNYHSVIINPNVIYSALTEL